MSTYNGEKYLNEQLESIFMQQVKEIEADYYAFCDQDDIWDSNKLQLGMEALNGINDEALWCSN